MERRKKKFNAGFVGIVHLLSLLSARKILSFKALWHTKPPSFTSTPRPPTGQ